MSPKEWGIAPHKGAADIELGRVAGGAVRRHQTHQREVPCTKLGGGAGCGAQAA
jgi:hypothetical protein